MRIVIVGNGIAGTSLVEEILRHSNGKDVQLHVFGEERYVGYNRILLTEVLSGKKAFSEVYIRRWQWYEEQGVRLEVGRKVSRIIPERKVILTENGGKFKYDKAVIATGSKPYIPTSLVGAQKVGVFTLRNADDVFKILDYTRISKRAIVIGGGLLGIEVATALRDVGLEVYIVHIHTTLMEQQLDHTASELLKRGLERMGIHILLGKRSEEILGDRRVEGVRFADGEKLYADFVVIATGVVPNVEVAKNSGIEVNKGVVVDDYMRTSAVDVYAVGECVEHRGKTFGFIAPIMEQVRVCAHNLLYGDGKKFEGFLTYTMLNVAGINLLSAGDFKEKDGDEVVSFLDSGKGVYRKAIIRNGKVVGLILYGDVRGNDELLGYVRTCREVSEESSTFIIRHLLSASDTPQVHDLKDIDIVCNCNTVTKGDVIRAILDGKAKSLEEVQRLTRASTSCGSCGPLIWELLRQYIKDETAKLNKVEVIKKELHPFDEEFRKRMEYYFENGDYEIIPEEDRDVRLKWHGIFYRKATPGFFMVRIRVPNGRLTYEQAKVIAHLSEMFARKEVEITSRQQVQIRYLNLKDLPQVLGALEKVGLSTLQTGMDNVRNVTGDPLTGLAEDSFIDTLRLTKDLTYVFLGRKRYADLPRKVNVAVLGSQTDCINAMYNDVCFYLAQKGSKLGFNLYVGGKMGSGGPMRAVDMNVFIERDDAVELLRTILDIYSTFGNREDRSKNRLYFLVKEWGVERFREEIERRLYRPLETKGRDLVNKWGEREGIIPLKNHTFAMLVPVPAGKISAGDLKRVADMARLYGSGELRLSVYQNLYITNILDEHLKTLLFNNHLPFLTHTIACAGSDTCSFGVIPNKTDAIRVAKHLSERVSLYTPIRMHWSACAKGCGQHGCADIGFVGTKTKVDGKTVLAVDIFLGGTPSKEGFRIVQGLPLERVEQAVERLIRFYLKHRQHCESFSEFVHRVGTDVLKAVLFGQEVLA